MTQDIQFQLNEGPPYTERERERETYTYIGLWNMDEHKLMEQWHDHKLR